MSANGLERERIPTQILTGIVSRISFEGGPRHVFLDDRYKNPDGTYQSDKAIRHLQDGEVLTIHGSKDQDQFHHTWQGTIKLRARRKPLPGAPLQRQAGVRTRKWDKWFSEDRPATLMTPVYSDGPKGPTGYYDIAVPHGQPVSAPDVAGK